MLIVTTSMTRSAKTATATTATTASTETTATTATTATTPTITKILNLTKEQHQLLHKPWWYLQHLKQQQQQQNFNIWQNSNSYTKHDDSCNINDNSSNNNDDDNWISNLHNSPHPPPVPLSPPQIFFSPSSESKKPFPIHPFILSLGLIFVKCSMSAVPNFGSCPISIFFTFRIHEEYAYIYIL